MFPKDIPGIILIGFCAYMTTEQDTMQTATRVFQWIGIPRKMKLRIAVKTSSRAEANALRIEFKFLRNSDVTMPTRELLMTMQITNT